MTGSYCMRLTLCNLPDKAIFTDKLLLQIKMIPYRICTNITTYMRYLFNIQKSMINVNISVTDVAISTYINQVKRKQNKKQ